VRTLTICKIHNDGIKFSDGLDTGDDRRAAGGGSASLSACHRHVLSRVRPGATAGRGAEGTVGGPTDRRSHPSSAVSRRSRYRDNIATVPTSGTSRRRSRQFIRLTQSHRCRCMRQLLLSTCVARTCRRFRQEIGRTYRRWFHFYPRRKSERHGSRSCHHVISANVHLITCRTPDHPIIPRAPHPPSWRPCRPA